MAEQIYTIEINNINLCDFDVYDILTENDRNTIDACIEIQENIEGGRFPAADRYIYSTIEKTVHIPYYNFDENFKLKINIHGFSLFLKYYRQPDQTDYDYIHIGSGTGWDWSIWGVDPSVLDRFSETDEFLLATKTNYEYIFQNFHRIRNVINTEYVESFIIMPAKSSGRHYDEGYYIPMTRNDKIPYDSSLYEKTDYLDISTLYPNYPANYDTDVFSRDRFHNPETYKLVPHFTDSDRYHDSIIIDSNTINSFMKSWINDGNQCKCTYTIPFLIKNLYTYKSGEAYALYNIGDQLVDNRLVRCSQDEGINDEHAMSLFILKLNIVSNLYEFPELKSDFLKIYGNNEDWLPGENGQYDTSIYINNSKSEYIAESKENNIKININQFDCSANNNQQVPLVSFQKTSDSSILDPSVNISKNTAFVIGQYDASINNSGGNRIWSKSQSATGLLGDGLTVKVQQFIQEGSHHRDDSCIYTFNYDLTQSAAGSFITCNKLRPDDYRINGSRHLESSLFSINSNTKWYLKKTSISIKDSSEKEYTYCIDSSWNRSNVFSSSKYWEDIEIPEENLVQDYVEEYADYLFEGISTKFNNTSSTTSQTINIDVSIAGNTLIFSQNFGIEFKLEFGEISATTSGVAGSISFSQDLAKFGFYTDNNYENEVNSSVGLDPYKYERNDASTYYIKNEGYKTKYYFEYVNKSKDASIYLNGNTWIDQTQIQDGGNTTMNFEFSPAKYTDKQTKYKLYGSIIGIESSEDRKKYFNSNYTSIQLNSITEFIQDLAILEIIYDGSGSQSSLPNTKNYPKIKITSSSNFYINRGDATGNFKSLFGNWDSSSYSGYLNNNVSREQHKFWINNSSEELALKANGDPITSIDSSIVVFAGIDVNILGSTSIDNSASLLLTQGQAEKTFTFEVYGGTTTSPIQQLSNGENAYEFTSNASDPSAGQNKNIYYLKVKNTSNINSSYNITSNNSNNIKIDGNLSKQIDVNSGSDSSPILITITKNDSDNIRNFTLNITNTESLTSFSIYFKQFGGSRGVKAEVDEKVINVSFSGISPVNLNVTNIGTINTTYRILGEEGFIMFGNSPIVMLDVSAGNNIPIEFRIEPNNTDERREGYIIIEDIANSYIINTRIKVTQKGHNKSIFYLSVAKDHLMKKPIYTSGSVKGENILYFQINATEGYMDSSVSINVQTTNGGAILDFDYSKTPDLPAYYGDPSILHEGFKKFRVKIDDNPTDTKQEVYITVNAYYNGVPINSDTYNYNNPYSVVFKIYQDPNNYPTIVGEKSGDYYKMFDLNDYYYILGPGIGSRNITVNDAIGYRANWTVSKGDQSKEFFNVSNNPTANSVYSDIKIFTNNISDVLPTRKSPEIPESIDYFKDSSIIIDAWGSSSNNKAESVSVNVRRYPLQYLNASFVEFDPSDASTYSDPSIFKELFPGDFNGNDTKDVSIYLDLDSTIVEYTIDTIETNTTGSEFAVYKHRNNTGDLNDKLVVVCPKNIDKYLDKICKIIITYNYNNNIPDHTADFQKELTITVKKSGDPSFIIEDESGTKDPKIKEYEYDDGGTKEFFITEESYHDLYWDYSVIESGTSGNEFYISRNPENDSIEVEIPKNFSNKTTKTATIEFSYQYNGNADPSQIQKKILKLVVKTAPALNITLKDSSGRIFDGSTFNYYFGKTPKGSEGIDINVSFTDGVEDQYISWNYSTVEEGTSGTEFAVVSTGDKVINSSIPVNPSLKNIKTCNIIFKYKYTKDEGQVEKTKTIKLSVKPADPPTFNVY